MAGEFSGAGDVIDVPGGLDFARKELADEIFDFLRRVNDRRLHYLRRLLQDYNDLIGGIAGEGYSFNFDPESSFAHLTFSRSLAMIESELPKYPCWLCLVQGKLRPDCACRGRGWFHGSEQAEATRALLKARGREPVESPTRRAVLLARAAARSPIVRAVQLLTESISYDESPHDS